MDTYFVKAIFNDIDHYSEVVKQWEVDFKQLDRGKLNAVMSIVGSKYFQVFSTSYNRALLQKGASPKNPSNLH